MGKQLWIPTDLDREHARVGLEMQATAHGLNVEDDNVKAFIDHLVEVMATDAAQMRYKENCLAEIWKAKISNFEPGDVTNATTYGEWIKHGDGPLIFSGKTEIEVHYKGHNCTFNEIREAGKPHPNAARIEKYRLIHHHAPWNKT